MRMQPALDKRIAVVVWAAQQDRARHWAQSLNAPIYCLTWMPLNSKSMITAPMRYVRQSIDTWRVLNKQKPAIIIVTNPPIFACMVVYLYCRKTGAQYVMDTHPPALYSRRWAWSLPLQRLLARPALVNVVDQERYQNLFMTWGARAIVLPNLPVEIPMPEPKSRSSEKSFEITVVNTFAADEPLEPIWQAARDLQDVKFYILGDTGLAPKGILTSAPENITFTGYLRGIDYWQRVVSSDALICLTTYPYSLLAGAKDGLMARIPMLLSRQPVLTDYFTKGVVFVDNTAGSIIEGVHQIRLRQNELRHEIADLLREKHTDWRADFQRFGQIIGAEL